MSRKYFSTIAAAFAISILLFSTFATAAFGSLGIGYTLLDGRLKPGQGSAATLVFSNAASGTAYNIKVSASPGSFVIPEKTSFDLGTIGPGASQSTSLNFNIGNAATSGVSSITLTATYNIEGATAGQQTVVTIPITIYREPILQLSGVAFNASRIKPDDTVRMNFDVANVGAGGARDVRISLQNSSAYSFIGSNELYSPSIAPAGSQPFSFLLQTGSGASPGIYSVPIHLSYNYEDGKQNKTEAKLAQMEIFGKAKLGISSIKTDPALVKEGEFASLIIKVENTGTGDAKSVRVSIDSPFLKNQVSLGKIAADEDASAVFAFSAGSAGDMPYTLAVGYSDDFGKGGISENGKLTVYKKGADGTIYIIAAAIIVAVGFLLYRKMKK